MNSVRLVVVFLTGFGMLMARPAYGEKGNSLLREFLATTVSAEMWNLANWLEVSQLEEHEVAQLIAAAHGTTSEERRNTIWHALRCSRAVKAREYLRTTLVADSSASTRIRYVQSLRNPAPFDVPLLVALYRSGESDAAKRAPSGNETGDISTVQEELLKWASLTDRQMIEYYLSNPPSSIANANVSSVRDRRQTLATETKQEFLLWIALEASDFKHRLRAAAELIENGNAGRAEAKQIYESCETAEERVAMIPALCRRYAFDPYPILLTDEEEVVKVAAMRAMRSLGFSYGYSISSIGHGADTLRFTVKNDASPKVREEARMLLSIITGKDE